MAYHFRNLVFEGGGVKGIAYVGALQVLERKGILPNVKRVGGTSAGAINAVLLGLNFAPADTEKILQRLDFRNFLDDSWGLGRDSRRLAKQFGWYKGDFFRKWIADLIAQQTGNPEATFEEIDRQKAQKGFKDLYILGTNLSTGYAEVFSREHTPRMCVADAVRISMSIPLFFAAKRNLRGDVYVDGGLVDNYPIKLFDREKYVEKYGVATEYYARHNEGLKQRGREISRYLYNQETLGFRLDAAKEIAVFRDQAEPPHHEIEDFFDYAWQLVGTILNIQNSMHLHSDDWHRTIYIDTVGVKTTDFGLSDDRKNDLLTSGRDCTTAYFAWYDDPRNQPTNRP